MTSEGPEYSFSIRVVMHSNIFSHICQRLRRHKNWVCPGGMPPPVQLYAQRTVLFGPPLPHGGHKKIGTKCAFLVTQTVESCCPIILWHETLHYIASGTLPASLAAHVVGWPWFPWFQWLVVIGLHNTQEMERNHSPKYVLNIHLTKLTFFLHISRPLESTVNMTYTSVYIHKT